ncbi:hypothetical protein DSUL_90002 [Desulfovibrionales bacterium]
MLSLSIFNQRTRPGMADVMIICNYSRMQSELALANGRRH